MNETRRSVRLKRRIGNAKVSTPMKIGSAPKLIVDSVANSGPEQSLVTPAKDRDDPAPRAKKPKKKIEVRSEFAVNRLTNLLMKSSDLPQKYRLMTMSCWAERFASLSFSFLI